MENVSWIWYKLLYTRWMWFILFLSLSLPRSLPCSISKIWFDVTVSIHKRFIWSSYIVSNTIETRKVFSRRSFTSHLCIYIMLTVVVYFRCISSMIYCIVIHNNTIVWMAKGLIGLLCLGCLLRFIVEENGYGHVVRNSKLPITK